MNDNLTTLFLVKGFCHSAHYPEAVDTLAEGGVGETEAFHQMNEMGAVLDSYQPQAEDPVDFLYNSCESAGRWIAGFSVANERLPTHEEFKAHLDEG